MNKTKTDHGSMPVDQQIDPEVLAFRRSFNSRSPLDELVREVARRVLQAAIDAEVDAFIGEHEDRGDENGRRLVVKKKPLKFRILRSCAH